MAFRKHDADFQEAFEESKSLEWAIKSWCILQHEQDRRVPDPLLPTRTNKTFESVIAPFKTSATFDKDLAAILNGRTLDEYKQHVINEYNEANKMPAKMKEKIEQEWKKNELREELREEIREPQTRLKQKITQTPRTNAVVSKKSLDEMTDDEILAFVEERKNRPRPKTFQQKMADMTDRQLLEYLLLVVRRQHK